MLNGKITQILRGLKRVRLCVWMSCSHALIILCGVCTDQTVFSPSSSAEQSAHCVMYRATAVIMAIMSSLGQIGSFFMDRDREGGSKKKKTEGELTCCTAAGWGGSVRSGGTRKEIHSDLFTFAYLSMCVCKTIISTQVYCFRISFFLWSHNVQSPYSR